MRYLSYIFFIAVALTGCTTSPESRELAIETASAVQALDINLSRHAASTKRNADEIATRIGYLIRTTANEQSVLQAEIDASSTKSQYEKLRAFVEDQEEKRQKMLAVADASAKAAANTVQTWNVPSVALRDISGKLLTLGNEENSLERLKFSGKFIKHISDRIKQDRKALDKEAKKDSDADAPGTTEGSAN